MTIEEFERQLNEGQKLCVYNMYVIKLNDFINYHPGGAHIIKKIVGGDIGQFINGSLTNVNTGSKFFNYFGYNPHTHSSYAIKILRKLAIA